jgi:hypothetical protein
MSELPFEAEMRRQNEQARMQRKALEQVESMPRIAGLGGISPATRMPLESAHNIIDSLQNLDKCLDELGAVIDPILRPMPSGMATQEGLMPNEPKSALQCAHDRIHDKICAAIGKINELTSRVDV